MENKEYIIVIQCHIVKERCSGYFCEKSFNERAGGFAVYPKDRPFRALYMTCGGCCGKAVLRKLRNLTKNAKKHEGISRDKIVVQLSSCITKDNYHSSRCMHTEYIKEQVKRAGLDCAEDTRISERAEKRRREGFYKIQRREN